MEEQENFLIWVGLDVSKDFFTCAAKSALKCDEILYPPEEKFAISPAGVRKLLKWSRSIASGFPFGIAMETTGHYSARLADAIHQVAPEQHVSICNAHSISLYMRSFTEAKSDKADAGYIARYASERNPARMQEPDPETRELRETVRERDRLVQLRLSLKNSFATLECKATQRTCAKVEKSFDSAIEELENGIAQIVKSSENIRAEVSLMQTVPGVGFLSAAIIYAEYGSLRNYTRKQLSAMSGVCPVNRQSGTSLDKHRISHRGPKLIRRILFLDVQQTIRRVPGMAAFHDRMLARPGNSSKMTAVCACMRKLLLILRGVVVSGTAFNPDYVSNADNRKMRCVELLEQTVEK